MIWRWITKGKGTLSLHTELPIQICPAWTAAEWSIREHTWSATISVWSSISMWILGLDDIHWILGWIMLHERRTAHRKRCQIKLASTLASGGKNRFSRLESWRRSSGWKYQHTFILTSAEWYSAHSSLYLPIVSSLAVDPVDCVDSRKKPKVWIRLVLCWMRVVEFQRN